MAIKHLARARLAHFDGEFLILQRRQVALKVVKIESLFPKLSFKDSALKEIAAKAITKKTGARGLRSILESILLKTMYELPSQNNVEEIIVDPSAVKGQSQPITVYSKSANKSKTDKTSAA